MTDYWWLVVPAAAVGVLLWRSLRPLRAARREARLARARDVFRKQREWLEAKFVEAASTSGRPRGLRWVDCDFENDITYARDRTTGGLSALVGVTIRFEAIEGGSMEHVEAVGNLRYATAVFRHADGRWTTDGRTIFNLNPAEAIEHFRTSLIIIGQEAAERSGPSAPLV